MWLGHYLEVRELGQHDGEALSSVAASVGEDRAHVAKGLARNAREQASQSQDPGEAAKLQELATGWEEAANPRRRKLLGLQTAAPPPPEARKAA